MCTSAVVLNTLILHHMHVGLEELWFGITFDPLEESLLWQPACPVSAVATLCQKREDGICVDMPGSQNVSREKVQPLKMLKRQGVLSFASGST